MHESIEALHLANPPLAVIKYCSQGRLRRVHLIGREEDIGELEQEIRE